VGADRIGRYRPAEIFDWRRFPTARQFMDVDVVFAGIAVTDFEEAQAWYERFFGRARDIVANDEK